MRPVVLFRASIAEEEEMEICKKHFPVITQRSEVQKGDLVIPRYSALPYYKEFETDVEYVGGRLINSYRQHCYVADLRNWYYDLGDYTPRTWFFLDQIPDIGPFVLKGQTNSKKQCWNSMMYAENKRDAVKVFHRLANDGYIGHQDIYVRQFVPLRTFDIGLQGLPITEEYRFFILNGKVMTGAYYWSEQSEYIKERFGFEPDPKHVPREFLDNVINIVTPHIPFFVVDVARTEEGKWIVIELNCGSMSGLSDNDPEVLYRNMAGELK